VIIAEVDVDGAVVLVVAALTGDDEVDVDVDGEAAFLSLPQALSRNTRHDRNTTVRRMDA